MAIRDTLDRKVVGSTLGFIFILKELVQKGGQKEPRSSRNERLEDRNVWC